MIREYTPSRFHPCPLYGAANWCGGIAALTDDTYQCQRCNNEWNQDGTPKERTTNV